MTSPNTSSGALAEPAVRERAEPAPSRRDVLRRQREEFGGFQWGADFFGWLVAVGMATLLIAFLAAAGTAVGLTNTTSSQATAKAGTIGIAGGVLLLIVLMVAYYSGGYVAGRMARFDGTRQGLGVWLWGILIAGAIAVLAAAGGAKYNVLDQLNLPRIPIDQGNLTDTGAIVLAVGLVVSLVGAIIGGTLGARWHRRVDRHVVEPA
jgi:amino acid transporter